MTDRILAEVNDYWITVSIHSESGISSLDLEPAAVYSLAQYVEWLTEETPTDGIRRPEPNNPCPANTGVWGEFKAGAKQASIVHIAIIGDDDELEFGRAIALSPPVAAEFANKLIAKAVLVADVETTDEEEDAA